MLANNFFNLFKNNFFNLFKNKFINLFKNKFINLLCDIKKYLKLKIAVYTLQRFGIQMPNM